MGSGELIAVFLEIVGLQSPFKSTVVPERCCGNPKKILAKEVKLSLGFSKSTQRSVTVLRGNHDGGSVRSTGGAVYKHA